LNLTVTVARSLQADMQAELRDIERAVAAGTRDAGRSLRTELRRQVTSAGLGQRLANGWRDRPAPAALPQPNPPRLFLSLTGVIRASSRTN
jgi:Family of unknown function (DUF6441)